jgi:hypothetical protein
MTNQPKPQKIALVKAPSLKDMTREQLRDWAYQLHAKLVAKMESKNTVDSEQTPD